MMGFGFFNLFELMFTVMFGLVIGIFVITLLKGIGQWNKNNNSPRLTVPAVTMLSAAPYFRQQELSSPAYAMTSPVISTI